MNIRHVEPPSWGSFPKDSHESQLPPDALKKIQEIEVHIHSIETFLMQEPRRDVSEKLSQEFSAIGKNIDALQKIIPQTKAPDVMAHMETEFQFLTTHQDTFNKDQLTEFSLIVARLREC